MKLVTKMLLAVAIVGLVGCYTTEKYQQIVESFVGSLESELVSKWGVPDKIFESGGIRFLEYNWQRRVHTPGVPPSYQTTCDFVGCNTNSYGGVPATTIEYHCTTVFKINIADDTVVGWRFKGNNCKA